MARFNVLLQELQVRDQVVKHSVRQQVVGHHDQLPKAHRNVPARLQELQVTVDPVLQEVLQTDAVPEDNFL